MTSGDHLNWRQGDRYYTDDGSLMALREIGMDIGGGDLQAVAEDGSTHSFDWNGHKACALPCTHGHLFRRLTGTIRDAG